MLDSLLLRTMRHPWSSFDSPKRYAHSPVALTWFPRGTTLRSFSIFRATIRVNLVLDGHAAGPLFPKRVLGDCERYESQDYLDRHRENPVLRRFLADAATVLYRNLDVRICRVIADWHGA